MRRAALLALLVVTACGSSSAAATQSPSPSGAASASASAPASAAASPSPSPVATLPCKMPAELRNTGTKNFLGWLNLPSGTTIDDPSVQIEQQGDINGQPIWATNKSPQLYGTAAAAWSNAINGWVPVPPDLLAPDGIHYAYLGADGKIHTSNATSGQEALIDNPQKLSPIAYTSAGVVLVNTDNIAPQGLWLLDPVSQSISAITPATGNEVWVEVANGFGWGVDSPGVLGYPASKKLITAQIIPNPQIINPSSTATVVYSAPGGDNISNLATDNKGGVLVILVGSTPGLIYIPAGGGSPTQYQVPPGVNVATLGPLNHADAHGIWFYGNSGVFLFNTTTGLAKIAGPVNSGFGSAGDCV
jgi:hypothetical protein